MELTSDVDRAQEQVYKKRSAVIWIVFLDIAFVEWLRDVHWSFPTILRPVFVRTAIGCHGTPVVTRLTLETRREGRTKTTEVGIRNAIWAALIGCDIAPGAAW